MKFTQWTWFFCVVRDIIIIFGTRECFSAICKITIRSPFRIIFSSSEQCDAAHFYCVTKYNPDVIRKMAVLNQNFFHTTYSVKQLSCDGNLIKPSKQSSLLLTGDLCIVSFLMCAHWLYFIYHACVYTSASRDEIGKENRQFCQLANKPLHSVLAFKKCRRKQVLCSHFFHSKSRTMRQAIFQISIKMQTHSFKRGKKKRQTKTTKFFFSSSF